MKTVSVDMIRPGMISAADLRSPQGRLILPSGSAVRAEHIAAMRSWGITSLAVADKTCSSPGSEDVFSEEHPCADYLRELFSKTDLCHPAMEQLAKLKAELCLNPEEVPPGKPVLPQGAGPSPGAPLDMDRLISREAELLSLPQVFRKIMDAVNNPQSSVAYVAELIAGDVGLSARLLRLVNSAHFGLSTKIDTLERAVAITGMNRLLSLASGVGIVSRFRGIRSDLITMEGFWRHSIFCAITARLLAQRGGLPGRESFFVGGLLHDIGRLLLLRASPERMRAAILDSAESGDELSLAETRHLGFDHSAFGGRLLKQWSFSDTLCDMVENHHAPHKAQAPENAAIIHIADISAHALDVGNSGMHSIPALSNDVWDTVGIPPEDFPLIIRQAMHQLDQLVRVFLDPEAVSAGQ